MESKAWRQGIQKGLSIIMHVGRKKLIFIVGLSSLILLFAGVIAMAKNVQYSIVPRPDGGYTVSILSSKRHWSPLTAEGIFPKENATYQIEILGQGKDWSYRNQKGYYYSLAEIKCDRIHWDLGYVWLDSERKTLYFNLFWVSAPDKLIKANINGKYVVQE